jgi:hypothetical protein
MGRNPREQAEIEMWNRRMELELFGSIGQTSARGAIEPPMEHANFYYVSPSICGRPRTIRRVGA